MILTFDKAHLRTLLDLSRKTARKTPILEQLVSPTYWRDDIDPARRAQLDAEVGKDGFAFSARSADVDPDKLPTGLIVVGDQGVYIMSQAPIDEVKVAGISHVAYAREIDPGKVDFDTWYDRKRAAFGGDDGTFLLSEEMVEAGLNGDGELFRLELTPNHFQVLA